MTSLKVPLDISPVISFRIASLMGGDVERGSTFAMISVHLMFFGRSLDALTEFKNIACAEERDGFT
jgi:hypothetical protein